MQNNFMENGDTRFLLNNRSISRTTGYILNSGFLYAEVYRMLWLVSTEIVDYKNCSVSQTSAFSYMRDSVYSAVWDFFQSKLGSLSVIFGRYASTERLRMK